MEAKSLTMSSSSSMHLFQVVVFCSSILLLIMSTSMQTISAATTTNKNRTQTYKIFINAACNSTTYPKDCKKALSPYASTIKTDYLKLCNISLSVTLNTASNTSSLIESVSKMKGLSHSETEIISDCAETISDAIDELKDSLEAMAGLQGSDRKAQLSNIRTWVSAALTDEGTCSDDFEGQKVSKAVKNTIKKSVLHLAKMTSNCLALFSSLH